MAFSRTRFDVIVVGARCAGSPLATLLARAGLSVCLVDRATFPSDSPSTHGILPPGVRVLEQLGALERLLAVGSTIESGVIAFDDIELEFDGFPEALGYPGLNVRRITLDAVLLDVAAEAGATIYTGASVNGLIWADGRVVGVETTAGPLRAPLVIGGDGARSSIARLVGAAEYHRTAARRIFLWSYFEGVPAEERRVWLGNMGTDSFLAGPTDGGLFLAAFVPPIARRDELRGDRDRGYEEGLARWPRLQHRLAGARRVGPVRMMSRWHGYFRQSAGSGWALVGDAGHFKDPTPGQGISDALRQVVALAPAIERALGGGVPPDQPLREWWEWRDRDAWEMYWFAQDMGDSERAPLLLRAIQERFAERPDLVEGLLLVLGHELAPSQLFSPSLVLSVLGERLRVGRGERLAVLAELKALGLAELRRKALDTTGARRPAYR